MRDDRRFQPVVGRFEDTYRHYHGGGLVAVVLQIADGLSRRWNGQWLRKRVDRNADHFNPLAAGLRQGMVGAQD
jgi:hypothetical protein